MGVKESMSEHQIAERLDDWRIGESVWNWIVRKTCIKPTIGGIETLAGHNISRTALRQLKKTQQCSLSRQDLRESLAKYTFEVPGVKKAVRLGYYGYSPGCTYVEPPTIQPECVKFLRLPIYTLGRIHQFKFLGPENLLCSKQYEINKKIKADFYYAIKLANEYLTVPIRGELDACDYCKESDHERTIPDELKYLGSGEPPNREFYYVYLSTHKTKLYGAASIKNGKGFELEVLICEHCLRELTDVFLMPVSSLIKKIVCSYNLSQPEIASELSVPQLMISRLLNDKIEFIKSDLLGELYALWRFGPKIIYKNEHQRLLPLALDYGLDEYRTELLEEMTRECDPFMPPWDDNPDFLVEAGAIRPRRVPFEGPGDGNTECCIDKTDFLGVTASSNEVFFSFKVEYHFWYLGRDELFDDEGTREFGSLSIKYILVDIENRLLSKYEFQ